MLAKDGKAVAGFWLTINKTHEKCECLSFWVAIIIPYYGKSFKDGKFLFVILAKSLCMMI